MRRFVVVLSVLVLVAMLLPVLSITAQPSHVPHENPATAGDSASPILLLLFHGDVFDLALGGRYQDAQELLDELRHANIPDELKYIVDRFNVLAHDLFASLDNLEDLLDEVSVSLELYRIDEARRQLEDAKAILRDIEQLRDEIEMAADTIGSMLYIDNYASTTQLRQAYDRLQEILSRMRLLFRDLDELWESLFIEYEDRAMVELLPTQLILETTPALAFVGDSITVSGQLSSDDSPLANRNVTIFFEGMPAVVTTGDDGLYNTALEIPYEYVTTVVLGAEYNPAEDDIGVYMASESPELTVDVDYHRTHLELSGPEVAYPGLPISITGEVSSIGKSIGRTVSLLLDNTHFATIQVEDRFEHEIVIPSDTSIGDHTLTFAVIAQDRYVGTSGSLDIRVSQFQLQADVQAPSLIVLPGEVRVSGQVRHDSGPLSGATVRVSFGESSSQAVVTSVDGGFEAVLEAPLRLSLVGPKQLTVEIEPVEPYYSSVNVEKWIVVINPMGISLMLIGLVSVGFVVYWRVTARAVRVGADMPARRPDLSEPTPLVPSPEPGSTLTGILHEILTAYLEGRGVVEKAAGIHMGPHTTLREFLKLVIAKVNGAAVQRFSELTAMVEVALYSAHELDESMTTRARQQADDIKKEINRDAA